MEQTTHPIQNSRGMKTTAFRQCKISRKGGKFEYMKRHVYSNILKNVHVLEVLDAEIFCFFSKEMILGHYATPLR